MVKEVMHDVGVTLVAPVREIGKAKGYLVSCLLVVGGHVSLDVATAKDITAEEAEPHLTRLAAVLAGAGHLHSTTEQGLEWLYVGWYTMGAVFLRFDGEEAVNF